MDKDIYLLYIYIIYLLCLPVQLLLTFSGVNLK